MYGKFLVEGEKLVHELLRSNFKIDAIYSQKGFELNTPRKDFAHYEVTEAELEKISTHKTPNAAAAVAFIPAAQPLTQLTSKNLYLVCDNLSDPGNAGTIIRTAEWFGIDRIFFSENSVDIFNPKVVNAAKGSLFRVECLYVHLPDLFKANSHLPVYGTFMQGENIYNTMLPDSAFIVIGNEANGIGSSVEPLVNHRISIPLFGRAESLNAAIAAGIVMSEFKRRI